MLLLQSVNMMELREDRSKNKFFLADSKRLSYLDSEPLFNFVRLPTPNNVKHSPNENVLFLLFFFLPSPSTLQFILIQLFMSSYGTSNNLQLNAGALREDYLILPNDLREITKNGEKK